MQRINTFNKETDLFGSGKHGFRPGNPATNQKATEVSAAIMNSLQEEVSGVIEGAGASLNSVDNTQLLTAILKLIEARVGDYVLDTGVANAYVIALNPAISTYIGNFSGSFKVAHANTGASTLNAGGGAKSLVNDVGVALASGDIPLGAIVTYQYIAADDKFYITSTVSSQMMTQAAADARYALLSSLTETRTWSATAEVANTIYQNTGSKTIHLNITTTIPQYGGTGAADLYFSTAAAMTGQILLGSNKGDAGGSTNSQTVTISAAIPPGGYYRLTTTGTVTLNAWSKFS